MKQNRYFTVCVLAFLCLFSSFAEAHTYRISAIVDTDMALDDMRALAMLLNSDMIGYPVDRYFGWSVIASGRLQEPDSAFRVFKPGRYQDCQRKRAGETRPEVAVMV